MLMFHIFKVCYSSHDYVYLRTLSSSCANLNEKKRLIADGIQYSKSGEVKMIISQHFVQEILPQSLVTIYLNGVVGSCVEFA